MSGQQVIDSEGREIINQDGTSRVTAGDGCGGCGCGGGGCWYYGFQCCNPEDPNGIVLAYPCTEPNIFGVNDPPNSATVFYQGQCFTFLPIVNGTLDPGATLVAFVDFQIVSSCAEPICGVPCGKLYQALYPCCAQVGGGLGTPIWADCLPEFWPTVNSIKIGGVCYAPVGPCIFEYAPPAGYLPGPYTGFTQYPTCEECCYINPPPPPVGCPLDCTNCASTYNVTIPPVSCEVPDPEGCIEPGTPFPCMCPIGDCHYDRVQVAIPVHKGSPSSACVWAGNKLTLNGETQTGCCVAVSPGFPGLRINDLFYQASIECGEDGSGNAQWFVQFQGGMYQRTTPPTTEGCPVGTYQKISPYGTNDACLWPDFLEVG